MAQATCQGQVLAGRLDAKRSSSFKLLNWIGFHAENRGWSKSARDVEKSKLARECNGVPSGRKKFSAGRFVRNDGGELRWLGVGGGLSELGIGGRKVRERPERNGGVG